MLYMECARKINKYIIETKNTIYRKITIFILVEYKRFYFDYAADTHIGRSHWSTWDVTSLKFSFLLQIYKSHGRKFNCTNYYTKSKITYLYNFFQNELVGYIEQITKTPLNSICLRLKLIFNELSSNKLKIISLMFVFVKWTVFATQLKNAIQFSDRHHPNFGTFGVIVPRFCVAVGAATTQITITKTSL